MIRYAYLGATAGLVVLLAVAWHQRDEALRAEGAARERLVQLQTKLRIDSLQAKRADSVVTVDTLRLVRWVKAYDTVRTTLRITDTVDVKRYVQTADSTIAACRQSVTSLTLSCAAKDSVIADLRAMNAVKIAPSARVPWHQKVLWGLGGVVIGRVLPR